MLGSCFIHYLEYEKKNKNLKKNKKTIIKNIETESTLNTKNQIIKSG